MINREVAASLRDVSFRYMESEEQLRHIDFTLYRGECVVLTGPSGSGKSTLMRLLNGLIPHFYEGMLEGEIELFGRSAADLESWAFSQWTGSVFQDSRSQFFNAVVQDEMAFSGENIGMQPELIRERIRELAAELSLENLLASDVRLLSGGEKQKVAFAAARFTMPELLILDEPSANLDLAAAAGLSRLLSGLKRMGHTLLLAEHRLYELLPIADRIVYMENGSITASWTPQELLALSDREREKLGLRSPVFETESASSGELRSEGVQNEKERLCVSGVSAIIPGLRSKAAFEGVSFALRQGEIAALSGPNGAGKSTLAKLLCGLLRERSGFVSLSGQQLPASRRLGRIAFVMQDSDCQLFADSVFGELMLTREKETEAPARAEQLLRELGLWELRDRHPAALSGGQKQRLAFAAGMMGQPDVLILDEPTSGLDGRSMRSVVRLLHNLAASGTAVLVITHDHELMLEACDRLLLLGDGRLQQDMQVGSRAFAEALNLLREPAI